MSVLIKGAKLPKGCFGCHLFNLDDQDLWCIANHYAGYCRELSEYIDEDKFVNERHPNCPIIEVTPHGRLIDADEFKNYIRSGYEEMKHLFNENLKAATLVTEGFCKDIDEAPTVIEAEE